MNVCRQFPDQTTTYCSKENYFHCQTVHIVTEKLDRVVTNNSAKVHRFDPYNAQIV